MKLNKKLVLGVVGVVLVGAITYGLLRKDSQPPKEEDATEVVTESYSKKEEDKKKKEERAKEEEDIDVNDDLGERVTEESKEPKVYNEEAAKKVQEEEDKRRKENEFATKMGSEELQKRLGVAYDKIDWEGVNLTKEDFKQWLDIIVPKYLDNIYTVNLDVENEEILVAVIGDEKETQEVEAKLKPVLLEGIKHSEYGPNNLTPRFYSGLMN